MLRRSSLSLRSFGLVNSRRSTSSGLLTRPLVNNCRRDISAVAALAHQRATRERVPMESSVSILSSSVLSRSYSTQPAKASLSASESGGSAWARRHSNEFTTSLRRVAKILSERANFWAVETWVPDQDDSSLAQNRTFKTLRGTEWRQSHAQFLALRASLFDEAAEKKSWVHEAWQTGEIIWRTCEGDVLGDEYAGARRSLFVQALKAQTTMIVPIKIEGKVVAVLSMLAPDRRAVDDEAIAYAQKHARGLLESGLSGDDISAPFKAEDYDEKAPVRIMNEVFGILSHQGVFTDNVAYAEVDWFFRHLEFDYAYFRHFDTEQIAQHLHLLIAAKRMAEAAGKPEQIFLDAQLGADQGSIHVCPATEQASDAVEAKIDAWFAEHDDPECALSLSMFQSKRAALLGGKHPLSVYIVKKAKFVHPNTDPDEYDLEKVATEMFLESKPAHVTEHYAAIIKESAQRLSPSLKVVADTPSGGKQLMFCFRSDRTLLGDLSEMFDQQGLSVERKFVEQFSNGLRVYSMFVLPCDDLDARIARVIHATSLLQCLPRSPLISRFFDKSLTAEEYTYASAVARFAHYFIHRNSDEYSQLLAAFRRTNDVENMARLTSLHSDLRTASVPPQRILRCVENNLELVKELYNDFRRVSTDVKQTPEWNEEMVKKIRKRVTSEIDERIMLAFVRFNAHVLKTNFFSTKKVSLSFRMSPRFIDDNDVVEQPFAIFMVLGPMFQGFHLRFREVSRGGIRLIPYTNNIAYLRNEESQFRETFNLAYTQNKKNKDIPEFGSKGTVLIDPQAPRTLSVRETSFKHYVSGLLDLIIPPKDNLHGDVKVKADHVGGEELLFLGPDENTADYMLWAAEYAKYRGYKHWKSITTGKPPSIGGIPHDTYGMTTRSVHRFVTGVLAKLGLDEGKVTKMQTGGPDGDLGSNEILISHDHTTSIVDGSGVIHDPNGLSRDELARLADMRLTVDHFDKAHLSSDGFFVSVDDRDVTLPDGSVVENGLIFRNEFHLNPLSSADLFVPCGGRPESVNIKNVHKLFDKEGQPRFRIIVEGANLFFTQDARLKLEEAGVEVYKDASTNKGGVTSSSLEVLAALALTDAEFAEHMSVNEGQKPPQFYRDYVVDVQNIIENNASLEFECIWKAHKDGLGPRTVITDEVSDKINEINDFITQSTLYDDEAVRTAVMQKALPPTLINLIGLEAILERVPPAYCRAVFSSYLASRYVYQYGINAPELAFFDFMRNSFGVGK